MRTTRLALPGRGLTHRLWKDRGGAVAVVLAALIIPLVGFVGLAIDTGRGQAVKARLAQALDAAALAGGRVYFEGRRDDDIRMFFAANFPAGFMGARVQPLAIREDLAAGTLTVSTTATLDTSFMSVLGFGEMTVAGRTVVRRADRGMELVLVMDNTGSMYQGGGSSNRINRMKAAAAELVDILYGNREVIDNFWIGLVPYTASVNVGSGRTSWLVPGSLAGLNYGTSSWKGCVEARDQTGHDMNDTPPSQAPFKPFHFASFAEDNNWPSIDETAKTNTTSNNGRGPNLGCGPAITPLTASKATVKAAIANMNSWHRGGTTSNEGLAWGWRVISPRWRGLWGGATPATLPLDYGTRLMDKVAIILTDGKNELYRHNNSSLGSDYGAFGRLKAGRLGTTTNLTTARRELNRRTLEICRAMKAQGVIIYAITFEVDNDTAGLEGKQTFRDCATTPAHYFDNPVGTDLRQTFRVIAGRLGNLRLAE